MNTRQDAHDCFSILTGRYNRVRGERTEIVHIDAPCTRSFVDAEHRLAEERFLLTTFSDINLIGHDAINKSIAIRRYHWPPPPPPEKCEGVDPAD